MDEKDVKHSPLDDDKDVKYSPLHDVKVKVEPMEENECNHIVTCESVKVEIKVEPDEIPINEPINIISKTPDIETPGGSENNEQNDNEKVSCDICKKHFKKTIYLKRHLKYVHTSKNEEVECKVCLRTFRNTMSLASHTRSVHNEEVKVTCTICNKEFCNKKKLINHMYGTHPKEDTAKCNICEKTFNCKRRLKVHLRMVHPDKLVSCPHCNKKVKVLQKHIQYSHSTEEMDYKCLQCNKIFPSTISLHKHITNIHNTDEVQCNLCQKLFSSKKNLRRHLNTLHREKELKPQLFKHGIIQCLQCSKKFVTNNTLLWHNFKYHSNTNNNFCTMCQKDYKTKPNYKRHLLSVHSLSTEICNVCDKSFKSSIHLRTHIRTTHAPPEAAVTCIPCQKTFKCKLHLRMHITAVHTTDGPLNCHVCQKEFASKKYMLKHLKSHKTEKECPCNICGKLFKTKSDVTKHINRVHKEVKSSTSNIEPNMQSMEYVTLGTEVQGSSEKNVPTESFSNENIQIEIEIEVKQET